MREVKWSCSWINKERLRQFMNYIWTGMVVMEKQMKWGKLQWICSWMNKECWRLFMNYIWTGIVVMEKRMKWGKLQWIFTAYQCQIWTRGKGKKKFLDVGDYLWIASELGWLSWKSGWSEGNCKESLLFINAKYEQGEWAKNFFGLLLWLVP